MRTSMAVCLAALALFVTLPWSSATPFRAVLLHGQELVAPDYFMINQGTFFAGFAGCDQRNTEYYVKLFNNIQAVYVMSLNGGAIREDNMLDFFKKVRKFMQTDFSAILEKGLVDENTSRRLREKLERKYPEQGSHYIDLMGLHVVTSGNRTSFSRTFANLIRKRIDFYYVTSTFEGNPGIKSFASVPKNCPMDADKLNFNLYFDDEDDDGTLEMVTEPADELPSDEPPPVTKEPVSAQPPEQPNPVQPSENPESAQTSENPEPAQTSENPAPAQPPGGANPPPDEKNGNQQ